MEHDFGSLPSRKRANLCDVYRLGIAIPRRKVHKLRAQALIEQKFLVELADGRYSPVIAWYDSYKTWMAKK